jgi:hypothetical protein
MVPSPRIGRSNAGAAAEIARTTLDPSRLAARSVDAFKEVGR